jgi:hypothetical protein
MVGWGMDHPKSLSVRQQYRRCWLATQRIQYQADRLVETLAPLGSPVVFLKGAALGRTVYHSPALRPLSDIDLLVRPHDFLAARDLLVASGFALSSESWHSSLLLKTGYPEVDLHQSPYHEAFSEALVAPIFSRIETLPLVGGSVYRLGNEDQLLHTLAHGLRANTVSPLRWMVDAIHVLRSAGPLFAWDMFLREAIRLDLVEVAVRGLEMLDSLCPGEVDSPTLSVLVNKRTTFTGLLFKAEREWNGPIVVWGQARRNGGLLESLSLFVGHYARQGGRQLVLKAISRAQKIMISSIRK